MTDNKNFGRSVENFLDTPHGKKLISKKPALEKLANSNEGQKVKQMLAGLNMDEAAKAGDIASLASAIQSALKTEEGAKLASQLKELMK